MKKLILPIFLILGIMLFLGIVSAEITQVTVEGRMVSMITGQPVSNMAISKWDGTKLVENIGQTDSDGKFSVVFNINEVKSVDRGDGQSNYYFRLSKNCYVGADVLIYKSGDGWIVNSPQKNENIADAIPVTSSSINFGDIPTNSMSDFELDSDIPVKYSYTWKFLSQMWIDKYGEKWKAGSYDSVFNNKKEYSQYFPVDSYVRIRLSDKNGNVYASPIYQVDNAECIKAKVTFSNKQFSSNLKVAEGIIEGPFDDNGYIFQVHKGWNILPLGAMEPLSRSQLQTENFRGAHFYVTPLNQYLSFKPEEMNMRDGFSTKLTQLGKDENWLRQNMDVFYNMAGWFYSKHDGEIVIRFGEVAKGFDGLKLYSGWNFKSVPPNVDETFGEVKGECNIEKVAIWNSQNQKWVVKTFNEISDDKLSSYFNEGLLLKVSSDCVLGSSGSAVNPPQLPNEPDQQNEYVIKKNYGSLEYNSVGQQFGRLPTGNMVGGASIKYGSPVLAIVIEYNSNAKDTFDDLLKNFYTEPEYNRQFISSSGLYYMLEKNNAEGVFMWYSGNNLVLISNQNPTSVDTEPIARDYLDKYPSSLK